MSTTEKSSSQSSSLNTSSTPIENNNENREMKQTQQSDQYLKQLNKASHKISKPIRRTPLENHQHLQDPQPPPPPPQQQQQQLVQQQQQQQQQQQHQPPVYNINKSDFRDVVQKLTGSPAHHDRLSSPPPIHAPKPPNSRLHRIRPPPLPQLITTTRSPSLPLNNNSTTANPINTTNPNTFFAINTSNNGRQVAPPPLSPLPPLPTVHTAAESPITAYMRYLRSSMPSIDSESKKVSGFSPLVSPRWGNSNPDLIQQQAQQLMLPPSSPLGFGGMISPSLLLSPSNAQLGIPQLAPPLSPSWRNL